MRSIALFPCSYTDGAGIIGELSATLFLQVYTDEMLFADIYKIPTGVSFIVISTVLFISIFVSHAHTLIDRRRKSGD